jgi:DNA mismatch repair protein MSH6
MVKLADESGSFKSKTIFGLLRGAPDLFPNVKHIQEMFKPMDEEGACLWLFLFYSLTLLIDADELIPADGKDKIYDEVVSEIRDLENSLEADLQKFEKTLGYVC